MAVVVMEGSMEAEVTEKWMAVAVKEGVMVEGGWWGW